MTETSELKLAKWPFLLGDALLLGAAYLIFGQSPRPMGLWHMSLEVVCMGGAACLGVTPFLLEYWAMARLAGASGSMLGAQQLRELESVAVQISDAVRLWQRSQEEASMASALAKGRAESAGTEVGCFTEPGQGNGDGEDAAAQSKREKSCGEEDGWLQVLVRLLDHVYALHVGALASGQPTLIEQVSGFQDACREATSGVGLIPFTAQPAEPFDPRRHKPADGQGPVPAEATIAETVATGYTFQGRLLRPALVRLELSGGDEPAHESDEPQPKRQNHARTES